MLPLQHSSVLTHLSSVFLTYPSLQIHCGIVSLLQLGRHIWLKIGFLQVGSQGFKQGLRCSFGGQTAGHSLGRTQLFVESRTYPLAHIHPLKQIAAQIERGFSPHFKSPHPEPQSVNTWLAPHLRTTVRKQNLNNLYRCTQFNYLSTVWTLGFNSRNCEECQYL